MPNLEPNLDMDALRTFSTGVRLQTFARAASGLGRSRSALSAQLRKLERQAGRTLLRREGRRLALTADGQLLLHYAERILTLNDEAFAVLRGGPVGGAVRVGLLQDVAEALLAPALSRFARAHPGVQVQARVERSAVLLEQFGCGALDLALLFEAGEGPALATLPMIWVAAPGWRPPADAMPLPLALFDPPCLFREAALAALDASGRRWRVALSSPGLSGLWSAAAAGLGVTVRTALGLPHGLAPVPYGVLPALPAVRLCLHGGAATATPAAGRLRGALLDALGAALPVGAAMPAT